jgi:hypothetical protein
LRLHDDPEFLDAAIEVFWIWHLPDNLRDQAFTNIFWPLLNHENQSVRRAALRRVASVARSGAPQNNPNNILQLIEHIWDDQSGSVETRATAIFALDGLLRYDESTDNRVSRMICAALRSEVSEFRHEAVVLIARHQGWKIAHHFRKEALQYLLQILKEERDLDHFILSAFDRVPGELPEWAKQELRDLKSEQERTSSLLRRERRRSPATNKRKTNYDIAISFAGEDRSQAERLAQMLILRGLTVFYDDFEKADLWGKDLFQHLQKIYRDSARYCIVLISKHYTRKPWTNHELRQAQERALKENTEYILPVRFDDTEVAGLSGTISYLDARSLSLDEIADFAVEKVHSQE